MNNDFIEVRGTIVTRSMAPISQPNFEAVYFSWGRAKQKKLLWKDCADKILLTRRSKHILGWIPCQGEVVLSKKTNYKETLYLKKKSNNHTNLQTENDVQTQLSNCFPLYPSSCFMPKGKHLQFNKPKV